MHDVMTRPRCYVSAQVLRRPQACDIAQAVQLHAPNGQVAGGSRVCHTVQLLSAAVLHSV